MDAPSDQRAPVTSAATARYGHGRGETSIAHLLERAASEHPDRPAVIDDDHVTTWGALDARARALGADLLGRVPEGPTRVGVCLRSGAPFLESYVGCAKAALVPFNINFRYTAGEIAYLLENADAAAVITHREFAPAVLAAARAQATMLAVYVVEDGTDPSDGDPGDAPGPAVLAYEDVVASATTTGPLDVVTGPDDLVFLYTGGTTGMPKATMWRQGDLTTLYGGGLLRAAGVGDGTAPIEVPRSLSAAPMMHGTGLLSQFANLMVGGTVVVAAGRRFEAETTWDAVARHGVHVMTIVGDPFAQPLVAALDAHPGRWDLSSLQMISSSGAIWSRPVKEGLLAHLPEVMLYDAFSASEGAGLAGAPSRAGATSATGAFTLGPNARVLADDGTWVEPGSGVPGRVAASGPLPVGYFKDPVKSAETFMEIDGLRYAVPGDYVLVGDDGSLTLLGRGSGCINTGGEKVYPEEVEEYLKEHPDVVDAACLGVADPRFGEVVGAFVVLGPAATVDRDALVAHVRASLATYKAPRHLHVLDDLQRSPNGKLDRRHLAVLAAEAFA